VTSEDFADQEPVPCAFETADWTAYRLLGAGAAMVESYEDKLELVAGGQALAVLPIGDRRSSLRPDLATVPVEDAPTSKVVMVSRNEDLNPMVKSFRKVAGAILTGMAA